MVQSIKFALALTIILVCFSCSKITDSNGTKSVNESEYNLNGLWSLMRADSSYAEIYFIDSAYWFFQSDNFLIRNYFIEKDDTIVTYLPGDTTKFGLTYLNDLSFVMTSGTHSTKYSKVIDSVFTNADWVKIIEGDEKLKEKYRLYFFAREYDRKLSSR